MCDRHWRFESSVSIVRKWNDFIWDLQGMFLAMRRQIVPRHWILCIWQPWKCLAKLVRGYHPYGPNQEETMKKLQLLSIRRSNKTWIRSAPAWHAWRMIMVLSTPSPTPIDRILQRWLEIIGLCSIGIDHSRYQIRCKIYRREFRQKNYIRHRETCSKPALKLIFLQWLLHFTFINSISS
jgi:hypothetical protein